MEEIYLILRLLFFAWILFLPQLLGVLVHYRIKRFPKLAYFLGFLTTTILSFYLLAAVFVPKVQPNEHVCGLGAMTIGIFILFFLKIQIIVSLIAQFKMYKRKF